MDEGPLSTRSRSTTAMLWAAVAAGLLFSGALVVGFYLVAYDRNPVAPVTPRTSAPPTPTASSPSPSATASVDPLDGVNTASVEFGAQAQAWICYTPTAAKPTVRSAPTRLLVTARVQWALERLGQNPGPIDGWFTDQTSKAVGALQGSNGLVPDGRVGPTTWPFLEQSLCNGPVSPVPDGQVLLESDPESDGFAADAYAVLCLAPTLPPAAPATDPTWEVLLAQFALGRLTGQQVRMDGAFGPETVAAVRAYQSTSRIPVTGTVDAATWKQLRRDACV